MNWKDVGEWPFCAKHGNITMCWPAVYCPSCMNEILTETFDKIVREENARREAVDNSG